VNPFYPKDVNASFGKHVLTPTLALTSLAGATPPEWRLRYWDENLLQGPPPLEEVPQVVGITVHLTFAKRAYELAAWFKAHGCIVVLGGLHALSCPDEVQAHADAICVGNGVPVWPRILKDIERGELQPRYSAEYRNYAADPPPDRKLLPEYGFLTPASLIATQGCHNRCDFCYLATGDTRIKYQMRSPAQVAAEFQATGAPYAVFVDNNLGSSRRYLRELCQALAPLEKIWSAAVTLDVTDDPSLVREMALAGCTGVFIGFESLTDDNIRAAGKKSPRAEDYARRVEVFHRNGIQVNGSFVLGFDHDRPDAFEHLVHEPRGAGGRLRADLPAALLAALHLGPAPPPGERRAAVPGHVPALQAQQLPVALPHPPPAHARGVVTAGASHAPAPPALPPAARARGLPARPPRVSHPSQCVAPPWTVGHPLQLLREIRTQFDWHGPPQWAATVIEVQVSTKELQHLCTKYGSLQLL
jgi:hypothetical protein